MDEAYVIDDVLAAEEEVEPGEAAEAIEADESTEDPSLEHSSKTERTGIDDVSAPPPEELPRGPALVTIRDLLGVPLFYERISPVGPRQFPVAPSFRPVLEAIVRQVQKRAPAGFGALQRISSAGMFVQKPGAHGEGRACDWDRVVFANVRISPIERDHASSSLAKRMRYWALGAICRSNCAFVLHGLYNADHEDHYHTDNMTGIRFNRQSLATVKLLQAVLNDIHGAEPRLATDGSYGQKSEDAFARAMERMRLAGSIDSVGTWQRFLRRSARLGFVQSLSV